MGGFGSLSCRKEKMKDFAESFFFFLKIDDKNAKRQIIEMA